MRDAETILAILQDREVFEESPTGEPDDRKRSSPVRRGAAETEPHGHRADRPPYLNRPGQGGPFEVKEQVGHRLVTTLQMAPGDKTVGSRPLYSVS